MKNKQQKKGKQQKTISGAGARYELKLEAATRRELLKHLIIWVQLPGIEEKQLDIRLAGNVLTIRDVEQHMLQMNDLQRSEIVGDSKALKACLAQVAVAAQSEDCVLVCGETGTGKELFARAVHQNSYRDGKNFVVVDCRSIPESIAEKLLLGQAGKNRFGHSGLLSQANRGTLFLDEIADLPLATQKLFCQLLQVGKYRPAGAANDVSVGFRLVCATNRNLRRLVAQGKFNPELFTLIQPLVVEVPPLRERLGDIEPLTEYFLERFYLSGNFIPKILSPEFKELLKKYPWPGNVRELENSLGQALLAAKNKKTLFPKDMPAHIRVQVKKLAIDQKKIAAEEWRDSLYGGLIVADNPL